MNLDETTLIEILDYMLALDEQVGLKTETLEDVRRAVSKRKDELKNLRLGSVVCSDDEFDFSDDDDDTERAELVCACWQDLDSPNDTCCLECFNEMTYPD